MTHFFRPVLTYINNYKHKVTILVIFIHQSFLQYISFHSMWAIQRETERNSGLSFCGTLSLISQLIWWYSQNVSSDSRKWLIKHLFSPSSCKKQINKQNSYLLLAVLQSVSVPGLDMHESKHFLPGQFVHSGHVVVLFTFQK
jgi:hypothetical protein